MALAQIRLVMRYRATHPRCLAPKTWSSGGPVGNGLFYWPRAKLDELCLMLAKTRWHMGVNITGLFNFLSTGHSLLF